MIVDCHTHLWDSAGQLGRLVGERDGPGWAVLAGPQDHLQASGPVDRCFVLGLVCRHLDAEVPNDLIAGYCAQHSEKMIGFAGADPTDKDAVDRLEEAVERWGLKGVSISPAAACFHPADTRAMALYELAASLKLPVAFHCGPAWARGAILEYAHPSLLDEVARSFPALKLIVAHMGHPWLDEMLVLLAKHPNCYADVSRLLRWPWQAYRALLSASECGVIDKLLFGSGFPFAAAKHCIETLYLINQLPHGTNLPAIPREQLRRIVERDALRLLGIPDVAAPPPAPAHEDMLDMEADETLAADET
jgi:predicted TIM-barrel fold metal-dependent hydrolase